ncbi:FAD-binding oxidoreductase, partial [Bacteroides pyogenes]|uniref:FAD-binding oxidoreductase n=1 Tax=Bacteroides pyogenes TaxID=310300 RepID=UPI002FD88912
MEALRYDLFLKDVQLFVDQKQIYTDELRTFGWGTDASFYRLIPKIVIRSNGEKQVAKIIQTCAKHKIPYTFRAAGTSLSGQSLSDSVLIVAGKNWEEYEILENGKKIRLQPGIVGGKVNNILKPLGKVFPPDPASIGSAMVGGIVNNNASGMNCGVHANSD